MCYTKSYVWFSPIGQKLAVGKHIILISISLAYKSMPNIKK